MSGVYTFRRRRAGVGGLRWSGGLVLLSACVSTACPCLRILAARAAPLQLPQLRPSPKPVRPDPDLDPGLRLGRVLPSPGHSLHHASSPSTFLLACPLSILLSQPALRASCMQGPVLAR